MPGLASLVEKGLNIPESTYHAAKQHQARAWKEIDTVFGDADVLVCPAALGPAPDLTTTGDPAFNSPWSYTGLPTVSVFRLVSRRTVCPLGLQFVGRRYDERRLLQTALWCEERGGYVVATRKIESHSEPASPLATHRALSYTGRQMETTVPANSPWVKDTTTEQFEADAIRASTERPIVVDFWAPWCQPCRQLGPLLEKLAVEFNGRFQLLKVNVDENQDLAAAFGVQSIPYVAAVRNGQVASEFVGVHPEDKLREWLGALLPSKAEELLKQGRVARTDRCQSGLGRLPRSGRP